VPSEPVCVGAVQVPQGGSPIVLMPDGPTVGGYPKIASVITADLGRFAQLAPAERPAFELVTFEEAIAALRDRERRVTAGSSLIRSL
jgi:allophanate hydrolase subunit 2